MTDAPNMPKAVAVWLIENTMLTFDQIADFCHLHSLEVQTLADEEGMKIAGQNPMNTGELLKEEIERCEADTDGRLVIVKSTLPKPQARSKGPRYTPVSKRGDKPDAIAWLLRNHPELTDANIIKLIGTTKNTINNIREKTHANMTNIKPRSPIELGLCRFDEYEVIVEKAQIKWVKAGNVLPKSEAETYQEMESAEPTKAGFDFSNFLGTGTDS
ncbi:MAG: cytoplasmic protein [Alphaproteobacteria bacterium]|nr:MAG: cytoplasmic protein [Alphaproteobacteria bacterium]